MALAIPIPSETVMPSFSLTGKKVFVTGGSRGIGRACALTLAAAGADIAIGSSPNGAEVAETVCEQIRQLGRKAEAYSFDVGVPSEVERMCAELLANPLIESFEVVVEDT